MGFEYYLELVVWFLEFKIMIPFVKYKNIFFGFTLMAILASVAAIAVWGLKPGVEFTGGSVLEIEWRQDRPDNALIREKIDALEIGGASLYAVGDNGVIIRAESISPEKHAALLNSLGEIGEFEEKSFEGIGPVVGKELADKMATLVFVSLAAMLLYIAVAFRNIPGRIKSWQYGVASFLILCHDIIVPLGVFALLGARYGAQITIPVITALLIVVGYAINNVIVVYDRVRENLSRDHRADFGENANRAVNQTLSRQINTSLLTLLPVFAIYFWGGASLNHFALALILGIAVGTYSSVFLAAQSLVFWRDLRDRKR